MARLTLAAALLLAAAPLTASAAENTPAPPHQNWSFYGVNGTFDRASAQRGLQVYNEVCSACHSLRLVSFQSLEGIGLTKDQVRAFAASKTVPGEPNEDGKPTTRPGLPGDHFPNPFPTEKAARSANNGALPPDQSLLVKAREGGPDYIYSLVGLGYVDPPPGVKVPDGGYYNKYFPGGIIHMPPPLSDGAVTYTDGTKATVPQMAHDVTTFLTFTANPELEQRHHLGVRIVGFLGLLGVVTYFAKRRLWSHVDH